MSVDGFNVVIPARFASTRLPGKPLLKLAGRAMVVRVADQARASGAQRVVVATDDQRIADQVKQYLAYAVRITPDLIGNGL